MKKLYPLKFIPIPKERVWGGNDLSEKLDKPFDKNKIIGESWEISGFENESSIIANGFLENNTLYDIVETYMDDIVGEDHFKYYGNEFPLLIKILDIKDKLSLQVHPDDETAFDRHNSYGKNEAWYVLESSSDAKIYMGFNRDIAPGEFYERCKNETLEEVLNIYHPKKGDFFFIESGTVHSAGGGLVIAEVQQLSDVTYRIYDWGREHNPSTAREMHLEMAFDTINYSKYDPVNNFSPAQIRSESNTTLVQNDYFTITELKTKDPLHIYTSQYESFILYFCVDGKAKIQKDNSDFSISKGEWVLVPASYQDFYLSPENKGNEATLLEIYIRKRQEIEDRYIISDEHEHPHDCDCGCK